MLFGQQTSTNPEYSYKMYIWSLCYFAQCYQYLLALRKRPYYTNKTGLPSFTQWTKAKILSSRSFIKKNIFVFIERRTENQGWAKREYSIASYNLEWIAR